MEIIRRGINPDSVICQGECPNCRSVMRATKSELSIRYRLKDEYVYEESCPVCKMEIVNFYEIKSQE